MLSLLCRVHRVIARIEDGILAALLTSMVLLAFLQITLRNLADVSLSWGDPMLRVLVLWLALIGSIAATRDDNHIRIDILSRFLPERFSGILSAATNLFSAAICSLITWHATLFVTMEYQDGTVAFSNIPAWILESIIPIGFGIMAIRFAINTFVPVNKEQKP